ncbi:polymorphic toxin type 17 domain-containing protein [Streptomyces sp. NPDC048309]|uniref:polymorphic toxin type 17 domain-containing protein n=1 Tax=Streptomyces sp. NPDC048309 TaxID=3154618 RepID=UPI0033C108EC
MATALKANPPLNPKVYPNYRPGRTTWYVEADWQEASNAFPLMLRLQLYRASDNQLVATRLTSRDTYSSAETTSLCLRWSSGSTAPKTCLWSLRDGVLVGKAGTAYYAKLSYATEMTNHWYKVPDQDRPTYREYWLPTKWTATTTSPAAPALYTPGISDGMSGLCTCWYQTRIADPVNTATGAVTETVTDTVVPGKGLPLTVSRSYSSASTDTTGLLGKGWKLSFEAKLTATTSTVTLTEADGAKIDFSKQSDGSYTAPKPVRYALTQTSDGFKVTNIDHTSRVFNPSGQLTGWLDGGGQGLSLGYSGGKLAKITDAAGRETTFDVDATTGRLKSVSTSGGMTVAYGYEAGQLATVTGTDGGVTTYKYTSGRLATVVDPQGNTVTQNAYDTTTGRIKQQVDAFGGTYTFTWEPTAGAPAGSGQSTMKDPDGGLWTDVYEAGVLIRSYRPEGSSNNRDYDQDLNVTAEYDGNLNKTSRTFDDRGDLKSQVTDGVTETFDFDTSDRLKSLTNGRGNTTTYTYDGSSDRVKTITEPVGQTTYTYTADSQVETETVPGGGVTHYDYTGAGLVKSVTTPEGDKTTYGYDDAGRVKTVTEPRGNLQGADPAKYTTSYAYDTKGRLWKVTDPAQRTSTYGYDDNGNVKTVTDALGRVSAYEYNNANQLKKATDPDGKIATWEYDDRGNQIAAVDETGRRTTYGYDGENRLSSVTTPRGNVAGADPAKYTTTYGYDNNGNLAKTVDPTGALTVTKYDAFDQPYQVIDPMGNATTTKHDGNGNPFEVTDPLGKTTKYTYTANDLVETVTNPLGKTTTYGYDADGNQTSLVTPLGRKRTWTYDHDGRLTSETDPRGYLTGADPESYTTHYRYPEAGGRATVTDPLGNIETTEYDNRGLISGYVDANQHRTDYGYDALMRLKTVTAADGGITTYSYDMAGNVKTRTDDNQHTTTYDYDAAHRLKSTTDPVNHIVSYGYDPDGNRDTVTNARGTVATTTYNANNWPDSTVYSDGTPSVSFTYNADGTRKTITDATGTRTLDYYKDARLKSVITKGQTQGFSYTYDDAGQLTGRTTTFTYTSDGNRDSSTTDGLKTTYGYTATRQLSRVTLPTANGYQETRSYDRAGRLTDVASAKGTNVLSSWHAELDPTGQPWRVDKTRGSSAKSTYYTYDQVGRLLTECASATKTTACPAGEPTDTYTYDKVGNRNTRAAAGATTNYRYDAADRLLQTDTGSSITAYDYDVDGNQIKAGSTTFGYDAENRLTGVTTSSTKYGFTYDADGLRTQATKSGAALRTTTWDINYGDDLARVATETNGFGSLIADYQYDPADQIQAETTGAGAFYYHHDLLGSVTDITDSAGAAQTAYDYTAFGELTTTNIAASPPANRFTFTGEYKEPTTSTAGYYLRARNYDPGTGRFSTRDPYAPEQDTPYTQPYAYAENMPTSRTDPSGMCSVTTQLKDVFTGNWGWNNNCQKEDRETAQQSAAVQEAKALSDTITNGAVEISGQASLGLIDGLTFGTFGYVTGAEVTCAPAYNFGLYASMVPFPIAGGGKRLAADAAEAGIRGTVKTGLKTLIKRAKLPTRGGVRYVPPRNVSAALPRTSAGGYIDKFGNAWERGPSRTPGEPFEWDVQLSKHGRTQYSWLKPVSGKPLRHLNVSLKGIITHVS